jgi:CRISPR-associated protein Csb1
VDITTLNQMAAEAAALRRRQRPQPMGGQGDKIFPPTYHGDGRNAQPRHVYERRRLNGEEKWCVLIDSVQSQANRLEECLLQAIREGVPIPHVVVDFSKAKLASVTGRRLSIPLLRYPIAEHLLLYGVGARPPPDGVR